MQLHGGDPRNAHEVSVTAARRIEIIHLSVVLAQAAGEPTVRVVRVSVAPRIPLCSP
jgi:hypothetical protein